MHLPAFAIIVFKLNQPGVHLLQSLDLTRHRLFFSLDGVADHLPRQWLPSEILHNRLHFFELETQLLRALDEP